MVRIVTSKTKGLRERVEEAEILAGLEGEAVGEEDRTLPIPSLYFVVAPNPYLKRGKWVRRFDDGYEECIVDSPNGRMQIVGYRGPVFPHSTLGPYLMAVKAQGLDWGAERQDRRRRAQ